MRRNFLSMLTLVCALSTGGGALASEPAAPPRPNDSKYPRTLVPDVLQGELWAAECLAVPQTNADCNREALQLGKPGGLLAKQGGYTLLLVDGRTLRHACRGETRLPTQLQARGFLHADRQAMTVVELRALCAGRWQVVNLPYSGSQGVGGAATAEVGNE